MVATRGAGWRLAPALIRLVNETDRLYPARSRTSDGSIGDPAHSSRTSDHNPDDGWVDAVDITDDDTHGCDVALLAHHLVANRDPRISYLIHNGTIWRGYDKPGLPAFTPQLYTGPNAHTLHLHVSVDDDHRADTGTWWPQSAPTPTPPQEDDVMLYDDPKRPGIYLVHGGRLAQFTGDDITEVKKMAANPAYVGKLTETGAEQFRKVYLDA